MVLEISEKEIRLEISSEVVNKMMKDDAPRVEKPLLLSRVMLIFERHLGQAFVTMLCRG